MIRNSVATWVALAACVVGTAPAHSPIYAQYSATAHNTQTRVQQNRLNTVGITELHLRNGITVQLKPTKFSENTLRVRAVAPGGYAALPNDALASGKLAAPLAIESGVGPYNGEELSEHLFKHSIDLRLAIHPFYRDIIATSPVWKASELLELLTLFLSQPRLDPAAAPLMKTRLADSLSHRHQDPETWFDDTVRSLTSADLPILQAVTTEDLDAFDFDTARKFYQEHFLPTEGWTFIVIGNFDVAATSKLVEQHLGSISLKPRSHSVTTPPPLPIPDGVATKTLRSPHHSECLARLTLPLCTDKSCDALHKIEATSQVLEVRLRNRFRAEVGSTQGIDVAYEMPFFPHSDSIWLSFQFGCIRGKTDRLHNIIIEEIQSLMEKGPTPEEMEAVRTLQSRNEEFWLQTNTYWLSLMANYALWGWDVSHAVETCQNPTCCTSETISQFLRENLKPENRTFTRLEPKR